MLFVPGELSSEMMLSRSTVILQRSCVIGCTLGQ